MANSSTTKFDGVLALGGGHGAANQTTLGVLAQASLISLLSLLTLVGVAGNSLVVAAVVFDKRMFSCTVNRLLLNLALADLGNLLFCAPEWLWLGSWRLPAILCPLFRWLEVTFLYASVCTQLFIAIDRYCAVVHPLRVNVLCSRRRVTMIYPSIWSISLVASLPYYLLHHYVADESSCRLLRDAAGGFLFKAYKWLEWLVFYAWPLLVIVCSYGTVAWKLWLKEESSTDQLALRGMSLVGAEQAWRRTLQARRGVVRMLLACVLLYFACYTPIQVGFALRQLAGVSLFKWAGHETLLVCNALVTAASALNPLLYTLFSANFRCRFRQLLSCRRASQGQHKTLFAVASAPRQLATTGGPASSRVLQQASVALITRAGQQHTLTVADKVEMRPYRSATTSGGRRENLMMKNQIDQRPFSQKANKTKAHHDSAVRTVAQL